MTTRLIRVKEQNAEKIVSTLKAEGYEAKQVFRDLMPAPDVWCYRSYPGENWHEECQELEEMTKGIEISCSGKQANKAIQGLKNKGVIQ